jgi:hypothetical protein
MTKKKFHGSRKRKAELAQEQPDTGEARNVNAGRTMAFLAGRFSSVVLARSRRCAPLSTLSGYSPPSALAQARSLVRGAVGALGIVIMSMHTFDFALHLPPSRPGAGPAFAARGIE